MTNVPIEISADYIIVGCGAVGMAFADIILQESDSDIIIIDKNAKPGGHWNYAYPYVRLHQPSTTYGVSSRELSKGRVEVGGYNDGLEELATGSDVMAYYEDIMRHDFLPTGRVKYFPMCHYVGEGAFKSCLTGATYSARARKKTVDATFMTASVPATHTPNFDVEAGVRFMPLNDLPRISSPPDGFVVIGGGKTGVDACLWLLENGVAPEKITWIISRDGWYLDRQNTQISDAFFNDTIGGFANQLQSISESQSISDMFNKLEACGYFLRIFPDITPTMFHGATIARAEVAALRQLPNVVRHGHVRSISATKISFENAEIPTTANTIHIDCSATPLSRRPATPVFDGDLITPQMIRPYQPVFSAAMIGHIELNYTDEAHKNKLANPVPLPDKDTDFIAFTFASLVNQREWMQDKSLQAWVRANRLDGASNLVANIPEGDVEKRAIMQRIRKNAPEAAMKLLSYLDEIQVD